MAALNPERAKRPAFELSQQKYIPIESAIDWKIYLSEYGVSCLKQELKKIAALNPEREAVGVWALLLTHPIKSE